MHIKQPQPYTNIPYLPLENQSQDSRNGAQFFRNVKSLQVGFGSKVFRVDRDGMWAGAETFASAPWRVDWNGNMTATSITISGYIPTGGALADIGSGNITETYIGNNAISSGKIQANAVIAGKIAANAVTATEINVSTLSAISANIGTVTAGTLSAVTITGSTITGGTIQTASSGTRVELNGSNSEINIYDASVRRARGYQQGWEFYNPSGTLVGEIYASSTYGILLASNLVASTDIFYGVSSTGSHSFHVGTSGTTTRMNIDTDSAYIGNTSDYTFALDIFGVLKANNGIEMNSFNTDITWGGVYSGNIYLHDGVVQITSGFFNLPQMSGATAGARSDFRNGSMYYRTDDGVIRVRVGGAWKTVTTA